jgi:hypothetical protein
MALLPHLVVLPPRHPGRRGILAAVSRTAAPPALPPPHSTLPAPWCPPPPPPCRPAASAGQGNRGGRPAPREGGGPVCLCSAGSGGRPPGGAFPAAHAAAGAGLPRRQGKATSLTSCFNTALAWLHCSPFIAHCAVQCHAVALFAKQLLMLCARVPVCLPALPPLQVKAVREAAAAAGSALIASLNLHSTKAACALLLAGSEQGLKWQARAASLTLLGALASRAPGVSDRAFEAARAAVQRGAAGAVGRSWGSRACQLGDQRGTCGNPAAVCLVSKGIPPHPNAASQSPTQLAHCCGKGLLIVLPAISPACCCPPAAGVCSLHGVGGAPRVRVHD